MGISSLLLMFVVNGAFSQEVKIGLTGVPPKAACSEVVPLENYDKLNPIVEASYHAKCDAFDKDPKNSCAYQEYLRKKNAKPAANVNKLAKLQTDTANLKQQAVIDKNKDKIEKLIQAYSKAQCGGMGAELRVTNATCNDTGWCGRKEMYYDVRYHDTEFCSREDYQKALHLKEKKVLEAKTPEESKIASTELRAFNSKFKNDFIELQSAGKANSYYNEYLKKGDTKQKRCFDERREGFLTKSKKDNESLGESLQKSINYFENKKDSKAVTEFKVCEDVVMPDSIENKVNSSSFVSRTEDVLDKTCEVSDRVGYKDNDSNSDEILKNTTAKSIQDCVDKFLKLGYEPKKAVIRTSSNSENNAFTINQNCCSKDFKCLSDARAKEIKDNAQKYFTENKLLSNVNVNQDFVSMNTSGRNGDGSSGPCPYEVNESDIKNGIATEKKKSLTPFEAKQMEDAKYGVVSVRFAQTDSGKNFGNQQIGRLVSQRCVMFTPKCSY